MFGTLTVLVVVLVVAVAWWALRRALNQGDATAGGSFGDLMLGEKNTRKSEKRKRREP